MRFNPKVDLNRYFTIILAIGVMVYDIYEVVLSRLYYHIFFIAIWVILVFYLLNTFKNTYYIIKKDYLYLRAGRHKVKIALDNIQSVGVIKNSDVISTYSLSSDNVVIITKTNLAIAISPKYKEDFIKILHQNINNLE